MIVTSDHIMKIEQLMQVIYSNIITALKNPLVSCSNASANWRQEDSSKALLRAGAHALSAWTVQLADADEVHFIGLVGGESLQ